MKKILSTILTAVTILLFTVSSVNAAEKIEFELSPSSTEKDRLFTVNMKLNSNEKFSAGIFDFHYDNGMFEYRKAETLDDSSKISVNETDDKLRIVFLNENGIKCNNSDIFSITFKAVNYGGGYIDFNIDQCINSEAEFLEIGKCVSGKITVLEKSNSKNYNTKGKTTLSDDKYEGSGKSERESTSIASVDVKPSDIKGFSPIANRDIAFFISGIGIAASSVLAFYIIYRIFKRIQKQKKDEKSEYPTETELPKTEE